MCFDYGAIDIAVERLIKKLSPKAIILFGSASNGTADDDSDIDLLVIMETDLNKSDRFVLARGAIGRIGTPVDVLVYTPDEFQSESSKANSFVREVVSTGRVVYGTARKRNPQEKGRRRPDQCKADMRFQRRANRDHLLSYPAVCGEDAQSNLTDLGMPYKRTHDIGSLLELFPDARLSDGFLEEADRLTGYCVSTRYDDFDPPVEEMRKAFEIADSIIEISESL